MLRLLLEGLRFRGQGFGLYKGSAEKGSMIHKVCLHGGSPGGSVIKGFCMALHSSVKGFIPRLRGSVTVLNRDPSRGCHKTKTSTCV